ETGLGERVALRELPAGGAPEERSLTWRAWDEASRSFASALVADGHPSGGTVTVWADNRLEWPVADLGALRCGMVGMGVYPSSAPRQVREQLDDAGATALVVDSSERLEVALDLTETVPSLRRVVVGRRVQAAGDAVAWDAWLETGARSLEGGDGTADELAARGEQLAPGDDAVLIYTSGTTGEPKGARISHRCLLASARSIRDVLELTGDDSALSFLPYSHAAERVFGLYTRVLCGMEAGLVAEPARVWEAARDYGPTLFGAVPRHFEKLHERLLAPRRATEGTEQRRRDETLELGLRRSRIRREGGQVPADLEARWRERGAPLLERARDALGGRVRRLSSGGGRLSPGVGEELDALGLTVLGAYGLTEHLCVAFNRPDRYDFESSGPPMPGTELRIASDGEIQVRRGDLTFSGYLGRPAATEAAFTDDGEWLRTGDLGRLDDRGFLRVTGRKKDVIALSTGKTVAVAPIESALAEDPLVQAAVVAGDGRRFVSAVLAPRRNAVERWASEHGLGDEGFPGVLRRPELRERLREAVDRVNGSLSRTESVREFVVLERELSTDDGDLTATGTVRRSRLLDEARDRLEALYG
ncbi:MAG: AMP-dependent synthetase/ligase, partial [Gemmatimonadota bacterium]